MNSKKPYLLIIMTVIFILMMTGAIYSLLLQHGLI